MKDISKGIIYVGAFLTLFIPFLVSETMFFPYITGKNFTFRIIVEIIFSSWVLLAFLDVKYRPRLSALLMSTGALILVMFFADLFSEYSPKSFWSNYERMDGYVTLVHFFLYFVVLGSTFQTTRIWNYFLGTAIGVSAIVALKGLSEYLSGTGGDVRIDATLGNSTYMAVYMLFNIFLLAILLLRAKNWKYWLAASPLFILFVYVLLQTGTRGTFIGLAAGSFVTVAYFAIFARRFPEMRKIAAGGLVTLLIAGGGFWFIKDSDLIQNNVALARYANLDLGKDLEVRMTIWGMAWEGVKERPILGWGQGSFNYVFNKNYDPALYNQEPWFDRVHNIVLDWLIAGGFLGFFAYLSIFLALAYYLFWHPMFVKETDEVFSVPERALLVGLISGYTVHNLVVFDNLISYMFFAIVLAYVHVRISKPWPKIESISVSEKTIVSVVTPVLLATTLLVVYIVNVPAMKAATDIINSFRTTSASARFAYLQQAYERDTFANQEVAEQYVQQAIELSKAESIPNDSKIPLFRQAEGVMLEMLERKPGDARLHTITGGLYFSYNLYDQAIEQYLIASELSPGKSDILLQLGVISYRRGAYSDSVGYFKQAYELAPESKRVRMIYASGLILDGKKEAALEVIGDDFDVFANSQLSLVSAISVGDLDLLERILLTQVENFPKEVAHYSNLIRFYGEQKRLNDIPDVLEQMVGNVPSSNAIAECVTENMVSNKTDLLEGC